MTKFEQACLLAFEDWADDIPDDLPEPEYSEKHKRWVKKLFNKMRGDRYHIFTTRTVKVMLVAAVLSALLLTAFVIPSSREFIIDKFDIFSTYKLTEDNGNSVNGEFTVGYIPEGFELENTDYYSKYIVNNYVSNDGNSYTIYKYSSSVKINFNTQDMEIEKIIFNDIVFNYCMSDFGVSSVIWTNNDYIYEIDGQLSKEEIIKIAKTVK